MAPRTRIGSARGPDVGGACVLALADPAAVDARRTGAKAANLGVAASHGLPVLPGFVVTTALDANHLPLEELRRAWEPLAAGGAPLVVRSSSTVEDTGTSSMAGQFTTLLGVVGWEAFVDAVRAVLASAARPHDARSARRPMAVLVQRQVETRCAGVLFGLDPVSGNRRHLVVEAVPGTPDALVSGTTVAEHVVLSRRGRRLGAVGPAARALLPRRRRRRLAHLARRAQRMFESPQDIEWAFDGDDRLWMLQSRPVTAYARPVGNGPVLGPGPVAETFPDPLSALEVELWVEPLRDGIRRALRLIGAVAPRAVGASPIVAVVGGRVAADLELLGIVPTSRRVANALNPLRSGRRLVAAWRVGRLRASLPHETNALLARVDAALGALGPLDNLSDDELFDLLRRAVPELAVLHAHEVLCGMLMHGLGDRSSAAALALDAVRRGRHEGLTDAEIVARWPVVLALTPPAIGAAHDLPAVDEARRTASTTVAELGAREAFRLRCRWVQELSARAAAELATRLAARGVLPEPTRVRDLRLTELAAAVERDARPKNLDGRRAVVPSPPLPSAFRLAPGGEAVAVRADAEGARGGLPAGGGRAIGRVWHGPGTERPAGPMVLVTDTLDPRLAAELPSLAGLVAEAGSALAHLAILAREVGVPTVVAVPDARRRFPAGTPVLVDGSTGEVRSVREDAP